MQSGLYTRLHCGIGLRRSFCANSPAFARVCKAHAPKVARIVGPGPADALLDELFLRRLARLREVLHHDRGNGSTTLVTGVEFLAIVDANAFQASQFGRPVVPVPQQKPFNLAKWSDRPPNNISAIAPASEISMFNHGSIANPSTRGSFKPAEGAFTLQRPQVLPDNPGFFVSASARSQVTNALAAGLSFGIFL